MTATVVGGLLKLFPPADRDRFDHMIATISESMATQRRVEFDVWWFHPQTPHLVAQVFEAAGAPLDRPAGATLAALDQDVIAVLRAEIDANPRPAFGPQEATT